MTRVPTRAKVSMNAVAISGIRMFMAGHHSASRGDAPGPRRHPPLAMRPAMRVM
jgi:hypothetical protein